MNEQLQKEASKLFPTFDHWRSFLELADGKDEMWDSWFIQATDEIRQHFRENLPDEWIFEAFGTPHRDTRWFLREFGPNSVAISYDHYYCLDLGLEYGAPSFDSQKLTSELNKAEFQEVLQCFDRIDVQFQSGTQIRENRNFHFGSPHDGNFIKRDLAWYAAHEKAKFVEQTIGKIEKFTNRREVAKLFRELNQRAQKEAQ